MADTLFSNGTVIQPSWLNDVNTATYTVLAAVSAGPNNLTAVAASTVLVGYPRGVAFRFIPQAANTGPCTLNISSLGVKALTKFGNFPLVANDLQPGMWAYIAYDGVQFQLINPRTTDFVFPVGNLPVGSISGNWPLANVSGTLAIANGGTNAATAAAAVTNLGLDNLGFRAHNNGVAQALPTGVFTQMNFSTEVFDLGAAFAANAWTPPAGRLISMMASVTVLALAAANIIILSIFKNGVEMIRCDSATPTGAAAYSLIASVIDNPNGTDVYTVRIFQNNAASINTSAVLEQVMFSGARF